MTSDTILRTQNYYTGIDPNHYYKDSTGAYLEGKSTNATKHKDVYISDLLNNEKCTVSFSVYRETDNTSAPVKSGDTKLGIVRTYNPETNLLAIDCVKKRPSRLSTLFKRINKMRYVEPNYIMVSSISRFCLLRRIGATKRALSPKARSGSSPNTREPSRGGRKRLTRKRIQPRK
jgi:hypothetical protein